MALQTAVPKLQTMFSVVCAWLFQADLLQVDVGRPENQETTALGAALAAGLSVSFFTEDQIFDSSSIKMDVFVPKISSSDASTRFTKWKKAIERSTDLADLAP